MHPAPLHRRIAASARLVDAVHLSGAAGCRWRLVLHSGIGIGIGQSTRRRVWQMHGSTSVRPPIWSVSTDAGGGLPPSSGCRLSRSLVSRCGVALARWAPTRLRSTKRPPADRQTTDETSGRRTARDVCGCQQGGQARCEAASAAKARPWCARSKGDSEQETSQFDGSEYKVYDDTSK